MVGVDMIFTVKPAFSIYFILVVVEEGSGSNGATLSSIDLLNQLLTGDVPRLREQRARFWPSFDSTWLDAAGS